MFDLNSFEVKVSYGEQAITFAKEALSARLYVPGWDLNPTLHNIIKYGNSMNYGVAIVYHNNTPIAIATVKASWNGILYVFVRKAYRGMGLGKEAANRLLEAYGGCEEPAGHVNGSKGTELFFMKLGLPLKENFSDGY